MEEELNDNLSPVLMEILYHPEKEETALELNDMDRLLINNALAGIGQAVVHIRKFLYDTSTGRSWRNKT
jgi:hypothetical protein